MKRSTVVALSTLSTMLLLSGAAMANKMAKHPNLEKANKELNQALDHITKSQEAHEYELGGHAAKAKELIEQAKGELKQALEAAVEEHK